MLFNYLFNFFTIKFINLVELEYTASGFAFVHARHYTIEPSLQTSEFNTRITNNKLNVRFIETFYGLDRTFVSTFVLPLFP